MVHWICILTVMAATYQRADSSQGYLQNYSLSQIQAHNFLHSPFKFKNSRCYQEEFCDENKNVCNDHEYADEQICASPSSFCHSGQRCNSLFVCPDRIIINCSDPINSCYSDTCKNSGTCESIGGNYTCHCSLGFDENTDCDLDCRPGPADVVFALDSSMSSNESFEQSKKFASDLVSQLPVGEKDFKFALITYSQQSRIEFSLDTYNTTSLVLEAITKLTKMTPESTFTKQALEEAYQLLEGSKRTAYKYIILMSDGLSTDRTEAVRYSQTLRRRGIRIYTVGIGNDIEQMELLDIASESDEFGGIPHVFSWTQTEDCQSVLMNQTINPECGNCTVNSNAEIILMLDATLSPDDFELAKDTMMKLLEYLDVPNTDVKIGLTSFGLHLKSEFLLNGTTCCTICTLPTCVQRIALLPGQTANMTNALDKASRYMLHLRTSRNFLVVFSSGHWQDKQKIQETIQKLNSRNIVVLTVAIGNNADLDTILTVTMNANYVLYVDKISKAKQLKSLKSKIFHFQCADKMFT